MKTIFLVGAGQGLGNRVAERFSEEGFRVVLMARNPARLQEYKAEFENKGIEAHIRVADAASPESITQVFGELKQEFGVPDVLFYNVGNTTPDVSLQEAKNADLLMKRYQADVAGAYHAIQQVLGDEFSEKKGTVPVTGGGLALLPADTYLPRPGRFLSRGCCLYGEEVSGISLEKA